MRAKEFAYAFLICSVLVFGCNRTERSVPAYDLVEGTPANWTMSPDEAVLAATNFCERDGINLSAYDTPRIVCDSLDGSRFWCLLYDGVAQIPGNHFMLLLNDETGEVEFVPGE